MPDLKTVRTPCCCRQRRRTSDTPFMQGKTTVDLNSCVGSLLVVGLVVFVSFRTNEEGYPFETSTDDKCFFSLEIADGLDVRSLARSYRHLTIPRFTD